jgi:membrane protease YdiL (CAAX protease family)
MTTSGLPAGSEPHADRPTQPASPRRPRRLVAWLAFVLIIAALGYAGQAAGSELNEDFVYRYSAAILGVVQFAIFFGVLLLIVLGLPKRELFGLRRPSSWPRAIAYIFGGLVAIFALSGALSPFLDAGEEQGIVPEEWDPDRIGAFLAFGAVATFVAPVVEELTFRGVGFALLAPNGPWVAIITTGILFGAYHGLIVALPVLAGFGIVLGWIRYATGSVYPSIALHAIFNGIAIASVPFLE